MPDATAGLDFGILGELQATWAGTQVQLGSRQQRAVLVMLVLDPGRPVALDRLVDRLWAGRPPHGAVSTVHSYLSRLRRALPEGAAVLGTTPAGYTLHVARSQVDAFRFEDLSARGRRELEDGHLEQADETLTAALGLWRGRCLPEFAEHPVAQAAVDRFEGLRLMTTEDATDVALALGRHGEVINNLEQLLHANPLRERMWAQLVLALYRAGRQADALAALRTVRRELAEQLGVDPGPGLKKLEAQVLAQDESLDKSPGSGRANRSRTSWQDGVAPRPGHQVRPFVGRDAELETLSQLLALASGGHGQVAVVTGEPGIGKTELALRSAELSVGRHTAVIWARCEELEGQPALWPWLQVLRTIRDRDGLPSGSAFDSLRAILGEGSEGRARASSAPPVFALAEEVTRLFAHLGQGGCVMLVLDDVHAADPTSLELLRTVAAQARHQPLLLLITHRSGLEARSLTETLAALTRQAQVTTIELEGLDEFAVGELLAATRRSTPAVARRIWDRTEGNPFFITEVVRATSPDGLWQPRQHAANVSPVVPAGIRDVLRARLFQLPQHTFELLGVAAVLGRDFQLALLAEVSGLTRLECATVLEPALVAEIVTTTGQGVSGLRFAHTLVRETVLADLSPVRAARLHARCAEALMGGAETSMDDAEPIAHHILASSGLVPADEAAPAVLRAADVALARSAHEAADRLLAAASELLGNEPVGLRQPALDLAITLRRVRLRLLNRGFGVGDLPALTDRALELSSHTDSVAETCEALAAAAITSLAEGDRATAQTLAQQGLDLAAAGSDPRARHTAHQAAARVAFNTGRIGVAGRELDAALEIVRDTGLAEIGASTAPDTVAPPYFTLGLAAYTAWIAGDPGVADALLEECLAAAELLDDPLARQLPLYLGAGIAMWSNDHERCLGLVDRSLREPAHLQAPYFRHAAQVLRASALAHLGDPAAGLRDITTAYEGMIATRALPWMSYALALRAEVLVLAGEVAAARTASADAVAATAADGDPYIAEILRIHGEILALDPATVGDAIQALTEGVRRAQEQGAYGFVPRLRTALERLGALGRHGPVHQH